MIKTKKKTPESIVYPLVHIGAKNGVGNVWTERSVNQVIELHKVNGTAIFGTIAEFIDDDFGVPVYTTEISLKNVSHFIKELFVEDGFLLAKIDFMKNKNGELARDLIFNQGHSLALTISGSVHEEADREVDVARIISVDVLPCTSVVANREILWVKVK